MIFNDFISTHWTPYVESQLAASTQASYRLAVTRYLQPALGQIPLTELTVPSVIEAFCKISAENPHLSRNSLKHLRAVLSSILTRAIQLGILPTTAANLTRFVTLPKGGAYGADSPRSAYTLVELKQILDVVTGQARVAVAIAGYSGLRQAEIQGLQWQDYHDGSLYVSRAVWHGIVGEPKTVASRAPVPVIAPLAKILDSWKQGQNAARDAMPLDSFILASMNGGSLRLDSLAHSTVRPALARIPLPWLGYHAFRRGLATTLMELGIADKIISSILRHAKVDTTINIYQQARPDKKREALEALC